MSDKVITIGGAHVTGTRFDDEGNVLSFEGDLNRCYTNLKRATVAARRKYKDSTISVLKVENTRQRYRINEDTIRQYGEQL